MSKVERPTLSVVVPVFNEQECLAEFYRRAVSTLENAGESFELVLVDDGSRDRSLEMIRRFSSEDRRVRYLSFSRNFGHQVAIYAGISYSRGQAVISIDADLQQPVEMLPTLISAWREGFDVVYTIKDENSALSPFRRAMMVLAYKAIGLLTELDLEFGQSDFRLLDAKVVDALLQMPEKRKFLRGLISWAGYKQHGIRYRVAPRFAGHPKYSMRKLFRLAFDGIFSFSVVPLRAVLASGVLGTLLCFSYGLFIFLLLLSNFAARAPAVLPPGWVSLMMAVLFLGSLNMISLGVIGEYIARIYEETRNRPVYLIKESECSDIWSRSDYIIAERAMG